MSDIQSFCGGPFQTNGYLTACGDKTVLFDAPLGITNWLQRIGETIDFLVLTHQHHDHIMDVAALIEAFNCPIWTMEDFSDELTLKSSLEAATGKKWEIPEFSVSKHLSEGEAVEVGGVTFQVFHVPGHSPDSLCYYQPDSGYLIGGDVLFQNSIGRTDFPNGSHQDLISGIKGKLWALPDDTTVYPGHGPETNIGFEKKTNPFIG